MYEMMAGEPPFYSKDKNLMFKNILEVISGKKSFVFKEYKEPDSNEAIFLTSSLFDSSVFIVFRCKKPVFSKRNNQSFSGKSLM